MPIIAGGISFSKYIANNPTLHRLFGHIQKELDGEPSQMRSHFFSLLAGMKAGESDTERPCTILGGWPRKIDHEDPTLILKDKDKNRLLIFPDPNREFSLFYIEHYNTLFFASEVWALEETFFHTSGHIAAIECPGGYLSVSPEGCQKHFHGGPQ